MAFPQETKVIVKSLPRKRKSDSDDDHNFHVIIAPVLALAQFFGLFPFVGVYAKEIKKVSFNWTSLRTLHSLLFLGSVITFSVLEIQNLIRQNTLNAKNINGIVFYINAFSGSILFFSLARSWQACLFAFQRVMDTLSREPYGPLPKWSLKKRIRVVSWVIILLALFEHLSSFASFMYERVFQATACNWNIGSWFYYVASNHLGQIYYSFPVNPATVMWAEYMNVSMTFNWSFIDLFVIIISVGIASMFEKINTRLDFFEGRIVNERLWEEIRGHYNQVCELQSFIDKKIGKIVCVACLSDLYFICLQLINLATDLPFPINKFYLWFSLLFLIARTSAMFFIASSIHDQSKKPLRVLRSIPNEGWFSVTQRFSQQVQTDCTALSGSKFFFITRGIIITIAGTIVTYELVLLQFNANEIKSGLFEICKNLTLNEIQGRK